MFTCFIRYVVDPIKIDEFKEYAHTWIQLINKYGGVHHGYFFPGQDRDELSEAKFSFPGLGKEGPENIAVWLFSFPDVKTYDAYRKAVAKDEECIAMTERFNQSNCFTSYERSFLKPIFE